MGKLIEYKGKRYEVGKLYGFFDNPIRNPEILPFGCIDESRKYPFVDNRDCGWKFCEEVNPESLGKITDAPVELVEGEWYKFEHDKNEMVGKYNGEHLVVFDDLHCGIGFEPGDVTNIKHMKEVG